MSEIHETKRSELSGPNAAHFTLPTEGGELTAWEEVEPGRFLPRRVRGSCTGRALG